MRPSHPLANGTSNHKLQQPGHINRAEAALFYNRSTPADRNYLGVRGPTKATYPNEVEPSANVILTRAQQPGRHVPDRQLTV
jgi:hypothetical protein